MRPGNKLPDTLLRGGYAQTHSKPASAKTLIKCAIEARLMVDPIRFGKPLRYSLKDHRRLRVSDYRIVYRIEPEIKTVVMVAIKHRKDMYEDA
jgi:addiction module RelE/StbE family toxin